MHTIVSGHHIAITAALRAYVENKLGRVGRYFDSAVAAHVILSVDKLDHKAEATLHINGGLLCAAAQAGDMYAAIDAMARRLDRQIKKYKEKTLTGQRRSDLLQVVTRE